MCIWMYFSWLLAEFLKLLSGNLWRFLGMFTQFELIQYKKTEDKLGKLGYPCCWGCFRICRQIDLCYVLQSQFLVLIRVIPFRQQDEELDELSASVERIGGVGLTIHEELLAQVNVVKHEKLRMHVSPISSLSVFYRVVMFFGLPVRYIFITNHQ